MRKNICKLIYLSCLYCLSVLFLSSCELDSNNANLSASNHTDGSHVSPGTTPVTVPVPRILSSMRALTSANLGVEVTVNGTPQSVSTNVEDVSGTDLNDIVWSFSVADVPEGSSLDVSITWYEEYQASQRINLATWVESITVNQDQVINLSSEDYSDGGFDFDADGASNLAERNAGSNPLSAASTPASIPVDALAIITGTSTERAPSIDGQYQDADYTGQNATFKNVSGEFLYIDNLLFQETGKPLNNDRRDGSAEMRWFAIHDGQNLYIGAVGEWSTAAFLNGDSELHFNDDTLGIYIDADNSQLETYDGINDYAIYIPLLGSDGNANDSETSTARISLGQSSAPLNLSQIEFRTNEAICDECQLYWEVKIPFDTVNLRPGTSIGLEVQMDLDHDGGDRDVRWGWAHPSGSDQAWQNPSFFGRVFLQ